MSSTLENKILNLQERLRAENESRDRDRQSNDVPETGLVQSSSSKPTSSPIAGRPRQRKFCQDKFEPILLIPFLNDQSWKALIFSF